jgi:hypothetical protein
MRGAGAQTCESGDHDNERTAIACDVYVDVRALDARSNTKIWPLSTDNATREPSGLYTASAVSQETMPREYVHDYTASRTYHAHSGG